MTSTHSSSYLAPSLRRRGGVVTRTTTTGNGLSIDSNGARAARETQPHNVTASVETEPTNTLDD